MAHKDDHEQVHILLTFRHDKPSPEPILLGLIHGAHVRRMVAASVITLM